MLRKCLTAINTLGDLGAYRWFLRGRVPVFMLHRVEVGPSAPAGMKAEYLSGCLSYLRRRGYSALRLSELCHSLDQGTPLPPKTCVFTIDDGFLDHFHAADLFDQYQMPLNHFLITDFLDGRLWPWDDQLAHALHNTVKPGELKSLEGPDGRPLLSLEDGATPAAWLTRIRDALKRRDQTNLYPWIEDTLFPRLGLPYPDSPPDHFQPMRWDQARDLVNRGHEVYPHTATHRILSRLPYDTQVPDIGQSVERVRAETGLACPAFAYPTGRLDDYNQDSLRALSRCGIRYAFNTVPGYVDQGVAPLQIPRFSMPQTFEDFRQIVTRFEALKSKLRSPF